MPASVANGKPRITVLGSGVVGLTGAYELSKSYNVTILARNLPGDPDSLEWASPWAGAIWLGHDGANPTEAKMQKLSYERFSAIAKNHPESSVVRTNFYDYQDFHATSTELWYNFLPKFRDLTPKEMGSKAGCGMFYESFVVTPGTYLLWLMSLCAKNGVRVVRQHVTSLRNAAELVPCDVLVNATGNGAKFLMDVNDETCKFVRGQVIVIRSKAPDVHIRHGPDYTYILPRGDGTAILGGIKEVHDIEPRPKEWLRRSIHQRCHELLPEYIPAKFEDLDIVRDQVGFRPDRAGGARVEREEMNGLHVVHAYGVSGGGYVYSHGVADSAARLVADTLAMRPAAAHL